MFTEVILQALTATGAAAIAWYLARTQGQVELLGAITKLRVALEREKQRNQLLVTQLDLSNAKLQFEGTLRSMEVATLRACLPDHSSPQAEISAISQSLRLTFAQAEDEIDTHLQPARKRRRSAEASPFQPVRRVIPW